MRLLGSGLYCLQERILPTGQVLPPLMPSSILQRGFDLPTLLWFPRQLCSMRQLTQLHAMPGRIQCLPCHWQMHPYLQVPAQILLFNGLLVLYQLPCSLFAVPQLALLPCLLNRLL